MNCRSIAVQQRFFEAVICFGALLTYGAEWGSITIGDGLSDIDRSVIFENSQMRVEYAHFFETADQHAIAGLYVKNHDINLAGSYIDACPGRPMLTAATQIYEDSHMLRAQLEWATHTTADITIYKDKPFIKIAQKGDCSTTVDVSAGEDTYVIHGSDLWTRGFVEKPECYFNRNNNDCADHNGGGPDGEPGVLLYDGWFIAGLYQPELQVGWGRVMPGDIDVLKLRSAQNAGFEWSWDGETSYLFVVNSGDEEILSLGRQIVDWVNGGEDPDDLTMIVSSTGTFDEQPFIVRHYSARTITVSFNDAHSFRVFATDGSVVYSGARCGAQTHCIALPARGSQVYIVAAFTNDGLHTSRVVTVRE